MKRVPTMIVAVVVLCAAQIVPLELQSNTPADVKAVTAAAEHFLEVFQNFDWEPFRALWVTEPTVFFPFDDTPQRVAGRGIVTFNLGQAPGPMGRRTLIFVRESGQWKLAHPHASAAGQR